MGMPLEVRSSTADDRAQVLDLCRSTLGWTDGALDEQFFVWKHEENPFGTSPSWVAVADGRIVGVRVFMRWGFVAPDGSRFRAVRAVDTATDPEWQGRGIFRRLTLGALPDLRAQGVDFVFNTPNDKSRPGYLKMGWSVVGRVPVSVRLTRPGAARRLLGARTAAERWSEAVSVGLDPEDAFADTDAVERLLAHGGSSRMSTDRSVEYLRWRYRFGPLAYRVLPRGDRIDDGVVVLRVRRRGPAVEATVCEVLGPEPSPSFWAHVATSTGADFALRTGRGPLAGRFLPVPRLGPILTWKPLAAPGVPALSGLELSLGDVEMF